MITVSRGAGERWRLSNRLPILGRVSEGADLQRAERSFERTALEVTRESRSSQKSIESAICALTWRAVARPDAEYDAHRREVVNLPSDVLALLSAGRGALVVHEVEQALALGTGSLSSTVCDRMMWLLIWAIETEDELVNDAAHTANGALAGY